jgi:arylsulfatase A-like enzyme
MNYHNSQPMVRITSRVRVTLHCLIGTLALFLWTPCAVADSAKRPNFLLILSDDQGWSQVSQTMHPDVPAGQSEYLRTPHIDRLGREGVRFSSGYAPAPICTPTRRSIQCGTTAARSGSEFVSKWIPAEHLTLPKALKLADPAYRCAHFGKWGEQMISTPEQCGYDVSDGMTGNFDGGTPQSLNPNQLDAAHDNTPVFYTNQPDPKLTGHITDRTLAFMRESVKLNRPFFAQASYYAIHLSIVCRPETLKRFEARGTPDREYTAPWAAMLEEMDAGVGRLLDGPKELGIAENTYVVFTSDNGGHGSIPGRETSRPPANHPLTGHKHQLYEGGIRVPFVVKGPSVPAGKVSHVPVAGYDLLPTFYDLAGGQNPLPPEVDGVSLKTLWQNPRLAGIDRPQNGLIFHRPGRGVVARTGFLPSSFRVRFPAGIELGPKSSGNSGGRDQSGAECGALVARKAEFSPELAVVVDAWPALPAAIKVGILAMIGAAK